MESEGIMGVGPKQMAWTRSEVAQALWEPARKNTGNILQSYAPWHTEMQGGHGQVAFLVEYKSWGYDNRLFSLGQWPLSSG